MSLHTGFFEDERDLLDAARECKARGIPIADVVTPYPIHGIDEVLGIKRSRLPWVTLIGGAIGASAGLGFQYWSSASDWPVNVGGKPFDSLPAFIPVGFEMTVLIAGLSTALFLLIRCCLWPGKKPVPGLERTSDDRLALILEQRDAAFVTGDFRELFERHGAVESREDPGGVS